MARPTKNPLKKTFKSEYAALVNAIHRCHNEDSAAYGNYGERGITVYEPWQNLAGDGFNLFIKEVGPKPFSGRECSLDRIDTNRGYEPGNLRWSDRKTQQNNLRTNIPKEDRIAIEMATKISGMIPTSIRTRYNKGWSFEEMCLPRLYEEYTQGERSHRNKITPEFIKARNDRVAAKITKRKARSEAIIARNDEIFAKYCDDISATRLAEEYGLSLATISCIIRGVL